MESVTFPVESDSIWNCFSFWFVQENRKKHAVSRTAIDWHETCAGNSIQSIASIGAALHFVYFLLFIVYSCIYISIMTAKTLTTKPIPKLSNTPTTAEKGVVSTLLQLFSTLIRKNTVEVALQAESALFDTVIEELKATRISPPLTQIIEVCYVCCSVGCQHRLLIYSFLAFTLIPGHHTVKCPRHTAN